MSRLWLPSREWEGQQCFIIGGGPSIASQNLELLRGRKIIAINTSYTAIPWADASSFLIFSDSRWWDHHCKKVDGFKGRIISLSTTSKDPRLLRMHRKKPPGLAKDIGTLAVKFTTLTAAINLAVHLGVKKIILLGIDGKTATDGRTHHHAPHPWRTVPGCWQKQRDDLILITEELKAQGIECLNASPDTKWDLWPIIKFEDCLNAASGDDAPAMALEPA